jgi:putative transposase
MLRHMVHGVSTREYEQVIARPRTQWFARSCWRICENEASTRPTLLVLDGSKAPYAGAWRTWGQNTVIQRCQVHKKRNVKAHVPEKHLLELDQRLGAAYQESDYETAKKSLEDMANWLTRINPDAAASLREGLEETLTVVRLGVSKSLRHTLATTNLIESALSVTRRVTARVT